MNFRQNNIVSLLIIAVFFSGLNLGFAAEKAKTAPAATVAPAAQAGKPAAADDDGEVPRKYPEGSVEAIARDRAKELPNPTVTFPPIDLKTAPILEKAKYSRMMCPLYVKAYEELYLKMRSLPKSLSPFSGYCEKRSYRMEQDESHMALKLAQFKKGMDRVVVSFETTNGLAAAQAVIAKDAEVDGLKQNVEDLQGQMKGMSLKMTQLESQARNERNAPDGFLAMIGIPKSLETKIVETIMIISVGLIGFLIFKQSQY